MVHPTNLREITDKIMDILRFSIDKLIRSMKKRADKKRCDVNFNIRILTKLQKYRKQTD